MNPLEERLRRLEPRPLPDDFWESIRSKGPPERGKQLRLKGAAPLAAGLAIFATLFALLVGPRRPSPEGSSVRAASPQDQDREPTPALLERLGSDRTDVRGDAARRIKDRFPQARPDVLAALGDTNPLVGERASLLLAEMADYESEVRDEGIHLLFHALLECEARRYRSAGGYGDGLLVIDPGFPAARTLRDGLRESRDGSDPPADLAVRVKSWKENLQLPGDLSPLTEGFRLPKFTTWPGLREQIRTKILANLPGAAEEPCPFARTILILSTKKLAMSAVNVTLERCLALLGEASGLRFSTDPSAREKADFGTAVVFKTEELSVKNTLRILLDRFGLVFEVTADGSVRVFGRGKGGGK